MLQVTMPLVHSTPEEQSLSSELLPTASVVFASNGGQKTVDIMLKGVIAGASTTALHKFLKAVSLFPGNRWTLQMQDLKIISERGIRKLLQFAAIIRQRGFALEIQGIHRNVYANLQELKLVHALGMAE
jgi:hypothetical protein